MTFPGAIPGGHSDVSSDEAFLHYGIKAPPSLRDLRYSARSKDDTYPVVAVFSADCAEVPAFVSGSSLRQVSSTDFSTGDVDVFAKGHGWVPSTTGDSWYVREFARYQVIQVLVHQAAGRCTVYLTA